MKGKVIENVIDNSESKGDKYVDIIFNDASRLRIGLNDDDYVGPEAMQCILDNGAFCGVWN